MAEAILNSMGQGRFKAYSAGSHPRGSVNPYALDMLRQNGFPIESLHSKRWDEFSKPNAPFMHFIFTVCDKASAEKCPVWPGKPMTAHWGIRDPASIEGSDDVKRRAFQTAFNELQRRIALFINLPFDKLKDLALKEKLDEIGRTL